MIRFSGSFDSSGSHFVFKGAKNSLGISAWAEHDTSENGVQV